MRIDRKARCVIPGSKTMWHSKIASSGLAYLAMVLFILFSSYLSFAEELAVVDKSGQVIFDDKALIEGYRKKYTDLPDEVITEMIKDETLSAYQSAAALKIFTEKLANDMVRREKILTEKTLLRRLNRADSPFVQVELMNALCTVDRYRYFATMIPAMIQKLDHYNETVNEMAFNNLVMLTEKSNRSREARLVFETLRKVLFLSRKRLAAVTVPGPRLSQKLQLLRWSIKVLGSEELQRLPKEVINLL
jgi:hypothetical protein